MVRKSENLFRWSESLCQGIIACRPFLLSRLYHIGSHFWILKLIPICDLPPKCTHPNDLITAIFYLFNNITHSFFTNLFGIKNNSISISRLITIYPKSCWLSEVLESITWPLTKYLIMLYFYELDSMNPNVLRRHHGEFEPKNFLQWKNVRILWITALVGTRRALSWKEDVYILIFLGLYE